MKNKTNDIWLFLEQNTDGSLCNASLEMLTPARHVAEKQSGKVVGILIGDRLSAAVKTATAYSFDSLLCVEGEEYAEFSSDAFTYAFCSLAEKYGPRSVMIAATSAGKEYAPRIACRLQTGLTADCTQIGFNEEKQCICWTGPAFGGSLLASILCAKHRPEMGTLRPGVFELPVADGPGEIPVVYEEIRFPVEQIRTKILETIPDPDADKVNIEQAEIVVAGGRGAGKEGFVLLQQLANALGGVLGATRVATDMGWAPESRQIGQTGKAIRPRLYIACGLSGAIQHLIGVNDNATIVAINTDPDAPIMKAADYAIVGDLFEVVPQLLELLGSK